MTRDEQHLRGLHRQAMAAHHQRIDGQMTKAIATMREQVMQQDRQEVRRRHVITSARGEKL